MSAFGYISEGEKRTGGQVKPRAACDSAAMRSTTAQAYYRRLCRALDLVVRRIDRPCMEIYRNSPLDTAPVDLLTDLCLPLRSGREG